MSALTIDLPVPLRNRIEAQARAEGITVEQFIARAADEKLAAVRGMEMLRRDAAAGRREDFNRVLGSVPDVSPPAEDRLHD